MRLDDYVSGHDTTAGALTWSFWEFAKVKHPNYQSKVRKEIVATRAAVRTRGDVEFSVAELESMTCDNATIKARSVPMK